VIISSTCDHLIGDSFEIRVYIQIMDDSNQAKRGQLA